MPLLTQGSSHSSDYFDDDPEFLKAIGELELPISESSGGPQPVPREDSEPLLAQELSLSKAAASEPATQEVSLTRDQPVLHIPSYGNVLPLTQLPRKRGRSPEEEIEGESGTSYHTSLNAVDAHDEGEGYLDSYTYGASRFGEFGEYMARKRAKLQVQNTELEDDEDGEAPRSRIFHGLQLYVSPYVHFSLEQQSNFVQINGWTEPSVQDLRKMIIQHGGIFHAYLDKKSLV